jgi:hypothetical protein
LAEDFPLVGLEVAPDQFQQRALPLAVAAEEAEPIPLLDRQRHLIQEPRAPEGQAHISQAQQRHE